MTKPDCLFLRNPFGGGIGQHGKDCARIQEHMDGQIRVNGHAEFHALFGVAKDKPRGFTCMNLCPSCASKAEKRGAIISEGIIQ